MGSPTWSVLKSAVTSASGQISTTVWPSRNHQFRLVFSGWSSAYPAASQVRDVFVRQAATVTRTSSTSVDAGDPVTLSGVTSLALAGRPATLQIKSGSTWKSIVGGKVSAAKTFSLSTKATGRGNQYYRVVVTGTPSASGAISATKTFAVYAWYSLDTTFSDGWRALVPQDYWRVAGVNYTKVLGAWDTQSSWRQYTLAGKCRTFKSTIGMKDGSSEGAQFDASIDQRYVDFGTLEPGQSRKIAASVSSADYLIFGTSPRYFDEMRGIYPAYAGATVSCLSQPGYM
ncbi:UNVERIFIED_ORG: hypothetical protein J2X79_001934 [Arthrobacter globiformis]|nr:hypothetical protein [Arthrobacter globiformis]